MPAIAPTLSQIRAQVTSIKKKHDDTRNIGIQTAGRYAGEARVKGGEYDLVIEQCDSPLALRIALRKQEPDSVTKVLLTPLSDNELPQDIRIRLARRRLYSIDNAEVLKALFQAHQVDPRVAKSEVLAEHLMKFAAQDCPAAPGGYLDLETVWAFLLERALLLPIPRPDLPTILKWSLEPENVQRFAALHPDFREAATQWLEQHADPASGAVLRSLPAGDGPDSVSIGLAAGIVFHRAAKGKMDKAVGKMEERYFASGSIEEKLIARWVDAADQVVRLQLVEDTKRDRVLRRADALLAELQAQDFAYLSNVSPMGFNQRLKHFATALRRAIEGKGTAELDETRKAVFEHICAARETARLERVTMAMRLVRWLASEKTSAPPSPQSFAQAVHSYVETGSFVDWARLSLRSGDAVVELSKAYAVLYRKARDIQEPRAKAFAELLTDWLVSGSGDSECVPVENILGRIVAPLAKHVPVLVLAMDGMSPVVYNQLVEDIKRHDWAPIQRSDSSANPVGIATVPSVTEYSRTSLLCGSLCSGNGGTEVAGFSTHQKLLDASKKGKPPVLFHKTALLDSDDGGISSELRAAIGSPDQRVVGVVVNAIDDYLLKGEQIDIRWGHDAIKGLPSVLYEARQAGRLVILLSDHGHVLEFSSECRKSEGGDRWRFDREKSADGEVTLRGPRVLTEGHTVIVPWTESMRYASKKNGYHGGANPQEMIAPVSVLAPGDMAPEGWDLATAPTPAWWEEGSYKLEVGTKTASARKPPKKVPESLLDWREGTEENGEVLITAAEEPGWIADLEASSVFNEQKRLAGRSFPKDPQGFLRMLSALDRSGGKMTASALARAIDYPEMRVRGLVAVSQRVLNLDGYEVLGRDEDSGTIVLNTALLKKQFEIG